MRRTGQSQRWRCPRGGSQQGCGSTWGTERGRVTEVGTAAEKTGNPAHPLKGRGSPRGTRLPWAPAHLERLGQACVQVEVVADHAAGGMALPVQHRVTDVIHQPDGDQGELLDDGDPTCQPFQVPVRLHSDQRGAAALVLCEGEEDTSWCTAPASASAQQETSSAGCCVPAAGPQGGNSTPRQS